MTVTGSSPGKIILFGEHAVVYGQPAIAVPVPAVQASVRVSPARDGRPRIISHKIGLDVRLDECSPGFWGFKMMRAVQKAGGLGSLPPFLLEIDSSIPVASGLGSGAAVAVASIRALSEFVRRPLNDSQVNAIAFEVEKLHHGTPSGIDNTVVTYALPVYFQRDRPIETFHIKRPFMILIADTGIPSPTALSVADVRQAFLSKPERFEAIFEKIGEIVREARAALESGALGGLGALMDENHHWLCEIGVSSPELETLVNAAREGGALGAKLSGSGRGGNMIALADSQSAAEAAAALRRAGAVRIIQTTIGS